jgi:hypothetical protein
MSDQKNPSIAVRLQASSALEDTTMDAVVAQTIEPKSKRKYKKSRCSEGPVRF